MVTLAMALFLLSNCRAPGAVAVAASAPASHQAMCSVPSLARGPLRLPAALPAVGPGVLVLRVGLCVGLSHLSSRCAERAQGSV